MNGGILAAVGVAGFIIYKKMRKRKNGGPADQITFDVSRLR
jgi:hypothetical protein